MLKKKIKKIINKYINSNYLINKKFKVKINYIIIV